MRIKFNDKIYRLGEIESGVDSLMELVEEPKYKDGDFAYEDERIMIVKSYPNMYHAIVWHTHSDRPNYNGTYAVNFSSPTFMYATEEERQILIDAIRKDGKRWNAEKKCIEDISVYKDGDFLHSDWNGENITIIYRKRNCIRLYYHASKSNRIGLDFDKEGFWPDGGDFRLATESEKKELIDALAEVGKRWNADKKCVEDWLEPWSDEPKVGDMVIAWNNDMSLAVIGIKIDANPVQGCKHVLNNNNSYKHAIKFDGTKEHLEKIRKG